MQSACLHEDHGGCPTAAQSKPGRCQRAEKRAAYRVPCRLRWNDPATGAEIRRIGRTTNISESGVAIQIDHDLAPQTPVEALLPHPKGHSMRVSGVVVHARRVLTSTYEVGVRFLHTT